MRHLLTLLAVLGLCVVPAAADEDAPLLTQEDLELVPLDHLRYALLTFEHHALFERFEYLQHRLQELDEEAEEDDEKPAAWRKAERAAVAKERAAVAGKVSVLLLRSGVDARTLHAIPRFPKGPLRVERYAFGAVQALSKAERQRALLERVGSATLGALLALDALERRLPEPDEEQGDAGEPDPSVERQLGRIEEQRERIRHRFWHVVDCVLDEAQRRTLVARLPHPIREVHDLLEHAQHLPSLTLGQGARIRALEAEMESEASADYALAERLERKLHDPQLSDVEREPIHKELFETWRRVVQREHRTHGLLDKVLTEPQRAFMAAIPPFLSIDQRLSGPETLLRHVELDDEQTAQLVPIARELMTLREKLDRQMDDLREQMDEMGPDTPQAAGMAMKELTLAGDLIRKSQAAKRRILLDVMTPDQVVQWVVGAAGDDE